MASKQDSMFSANDPLVRAIIQERLNQYKAQGAAAAKPASSGGMGSSIWTIPATLLGAYAAREMFGKGGGGGGWLGSILGGGSSGAGEAAASAAPSAAGAAGGLGDLTLPGFSFGGSEAAPTMGAFGGEGAAGAAEAGGLGLGSIGQYALPAAGIAAGAYGLHDLIKNKGQGSEGMNALQGAASGAGMGAGVGSFLGPGGTAIGAGIGGALGLGAGLLAGGAEHPEAATRGRLANELDKSGVMLDLDKGQYNIDPAQNNPGTQTGQLVGAVNPAAAIAAANIAKSPEEFLKLRNDTAGMMANKLGSSANSAAELKGVYDRMGGRDAVYSKIVQLGDSGMLQPPERDAALAAIDMIYGVKNPKAGGEDQARFDQFQQSQQFQGAPGAPGATPSPTPSPMPAGTPQPMQVPTGNIIPTGGQGIPPNMTPAEFSRLPRMPGNAADPDYRGVTPEQLAARKGARREPVDWRLMDLDPRFAGVFQPGVGGRGGRNISLPMGKSIFQVG